MISTLIGPIRVQFQKLEEARVESRMKAKKALQQFIYGLTLLLPSQHANARRACERWLGKPAAAQDQVEIRRASSADWRPVMRGERYMGDPVKPMIRGNT